MKRTVIKIDESLCNGCGNCVVGCHEGALQLIDGKAVMISDLYCDGLGACIGECPAGAISFEEREAVPYDEAAVMERLIPKGETVVLAHLSHLKDHNEVEWPREGVAYLKRSGVGGIDLSKIGLDSEGNPLGCHQKKTPLACGCPGSMTREIRPSEGFAMAAGGGDASVPQRSELCQFPVQLHLLNPAAGFLQGVDLVLAADCTAFACGDFHSRFLRGKSLAIACPKLDSNTEVYVEKLAAMIRDARINTLTVVVMEVPCCQGLVRIARVARQKSGRNVPIKIVVLAVSGEVIDDEWI